MMEEKLMSEFEHKCGKCGKPATWKCEGEAAQFGVPLSTYYCDDCKPTVKPRPKIMGYNEFPLKWTRLCCENHENLEITNADDTEGNAMTEFTCKVCGEKHVHSEPYDDPNLWLTGSENVIEKIRENENLSDGTITFFKHVQPDGTPMLGVSLTRNGQEETIGEIVEDHYISTLHDGIEVKLTEQDLNAINQLLEE